MHKTTVFQRMEMLRRLEKKAKAVRDMIPSQKKGDPGALSKRKKAEDEFSKQVFAEEETNPGCTKGLVYCDGYLFKSETEFRWWLFLNTLYAGYGNDTEMAVTYHFWSPHITFFFKKYRIRFLVVSDRANLTDYNVREKLRLRLGNKVDYTTLVFLKSKPVGPRYYVVHVVPGESPASVKGSNKPKTTKGDSDQKTIKAGNKSSGKNSRRKSKGRNQNRPPISPWKRIPDKLRKKLFKAYWEHPRNYPHMDVRKALRKYPRSDVSTVLYSYTRGWKRKQPTVPGITHSLVSILNPRLLVKEEFLVESLKEVWDKKMMDSVLRKVPEFQCSLELANRLTFVTKG